MWLHRACNSSISPHQDVLTDTMYWVESANQYCETRKKPSLGDFLSTVRDIKIYNGKINCESCFSQVPFQPFYRRLVCFEVYKKHSYWAVLLWLHYLEWPLEKNCHVAMFFVVNLVCNFYDTSKVGTNAGLTTYTIPFLLVLYVNI